MQPTTYTPESVFGSADGNQQRAFISPQRYIQGPGILDNLGSYLDLVGSSSVVLLASPGGWRRDGSRIEQSLSDAGISLQVIEFGGECSVAEIDRVAQQIDEQTTGAVVAFGGGKCVDAGKAVAHRVGMPAVVVPSLASNDAPCSALSVIYDSNGATEGVEFYPNSPALVVVDTAIVAKAPERYLVSGMGDAMATWFEARVAIENPNGVSSIGARPTIAAASIGEACARVLFEHGEEAASAVAEGRTSPALEDVVEANTLLSGLGFESGGLALAHGVAQSLTFIPRVHAGYLHGEMVAFGVLTQLMMEEKQEEFEQVASFFAQVGLPVTLEQLSMSRSDSDDLEVVAAATAYFPTTPNMPFEVTPQMVTESMLGADAGCRDIVSRHGEAAYRRLRNL